jgi:hypothetical protein
MFVLMEVETLGVARRPRLVGAHALRQRLSAGIAVYEARVYRKQLKGASEAKRVAHRRGEHVAPSSLSGAV